MGRFDQNGDGEISKHEFTFLVEFIFVINYIESVKPTSKVTPQMREQLSSATLRMFRSKKFVKMCFEEFDTLDVDKSGKLRVPKFQYSSDSA